MFVMFESYVLVRVKPENLQICRYDHWSMFVPLQTNTHLLHLMTSVCFHPLISIPLLNFNQYREYFLSVLKFSNFNTKNLNERWNFKCWRALKLKSSIKIYSYESSSKLALFFYIRFPLYCIIFIHKCQSQLFYSVNSLTIICKLFYFKHNFGSFVLQYHISWWVMIYAS